MKVAVFGANGKVGSQVVARLLEDGHEVRAFVHSASKLAAHARLEIVQGDVHQPDDVKRALQDADAVVSALGSWGTKSKDILTAGMTAIIPAMEAAGVQRIVSLTGAGARDSADRPSLLDRLSRPLLLLVAPRILRDGERHIALLRASQLEWTVVRSPAMRGGGTTSYHLSDESPAPWALINRTAVVDSLVSLVTGNDHRRSAPFITSHKP